jgi:hypothetical protein
MAQVEIIFGDPVIRVQCNDESLWRNSLLEQSIEESYRTISVFNRTPIEGKDSHVGKGYTSVGQWFQLVDLPGAGNLKEWIEKTILEHKYLIAPEVLGNEVQFKRSWSNRMFKGDFGKCHKHTKLDLYLRENTNFSETDFRADAVAIFYADVPENSSNLVFIKDGKENTLIDDYPKEQQHWLQPIQGELVIHSPEVWHAVSVHKSDLPRNVFVFDVIFV